MRSPRPGDGLSILAGVTVLLLLTLTRAVDALVDVHDEIWTYVPGAVASYPTRTYVAVAFEGTLTDEDRDSGLTFSVRRHGSASDEAVLLRYAITGLDLPAAGTPVNVTLSMALSCAAPNDLWAQHTYGIVSYCHPTRGALGLGFKDVTAGGSHLVPGAGADVFGLTIADERAAYGANPIPAGTFHCGGEPNAVWTESAALGALEQRRATTPRIAKDGDSGYLGVYFDTAGEVCQGTVPPGQPTMVYIVAKLRGLTTCGFAGTEFRFSGLPSSWTVFPVPNPDMFVAGDPFASGATMVFGNCQPPDTVVLYNVLVLATEAVDNVEFRLEARNPSSNPVFQCPQMLLCDQPFYSKLCVESVPCFVNSAAQRTCQQPFAVNTSTWGQVKALFR